jgi:hypothetical protein
MPKYFSLSFYFLISTLVSTAQSDPLVGHWEGGLNRLGAIQINFGYGKLKAVLHKDVNEITGTSTGWNPRLELHMRKYGRCALF